MLGHAQNNDLRGLMQAVKSLYMSRHYAQCTRLGERLLGDLQEEIHPIHRAYINFYTALSHDTLAREASLKNRFKELQLAEKHYLAAIDALTPSNPETSQDEPPSPVSSASEEGPVWRLRRSSSAASSATSSPDPNAYVFPRPHSSYSNLKNSYQNTIVTITSTRPQTPEEYQIAADTMTFVRMIRSHLANVQDMKDKTGERNHRFTAPPQMTSMSDKATFLKESDNEAARQNLRAERMAAKWRPRFDPSSVQQLCHEALAELC